MYLFYAMNNGYIPMGNDGQMILPPRTSWGKAKEIAKQWLGKRAGRVYLMTRWTQEMCEMGPTAFNEYIARHGELVAHS